MCSYKRKEPDIYTENVSSRRTFLKKAAYAAPTLLVMGSLTKPTQTHAGFGPPPSDPVGFTANQSGATTSGTKTDSGSSSIVAQTLDSGL